MTKEQAIALGWTVEKKTCASYDSYQDPCYVLVQPNGEYYDGEGDDYGGDWGDVSEDAAWSRLSKERG